MKLSELFRKAELNYPPQYGEIEINQIVTDSRRVRKGCLFLCIKGTQTDGHGYVDDAIKAGAAVIVAEQVRDVCEGGAAAYIVLENTRKAAALLYNALHGKPTDRLKIIGVTGTNGKTSVCYLLDAILREAGYRCGLIGTVECRDPDGKPITLKSQDKTSSMTTPDPEELYAMLEELAEAGADYVVMEVTSHALALEKVAPICFDTAVFTNLTQDHLDFHQTVEAYYQAKKQLFRQCRRAVICTDNPYGVRLQDETNVPTATCSKTAGDYTAAHSVSLGKNGSSFLLNTKTGSYPMRLRAVGSFMIENALVAASVAMEYGISPTVIAKVLERTKGAPGRMEVLSTADTEPTVIIDYAHTPDALEKLLRSARTLRGEKGRVILLFGCGGDRDRSKRKEMGAIATELADEVYLTSDNSRGEDPMQILRDILKGMNKEKIFSVIPDRRKAIEEAVLSAKSEDILLLAGKGHETYEITADGKHSFDEREIVAEALKKRR